VNEKAQALRTRTRRFAVRLGQFLRALPGDPVTVAIVRQLAKSGGSVSANYHACCRARSRAEFIAKLGIAVEEADESEHWLLVLKESGIGSGAELEMLYDEACQLRAILKASHDTARANAARSQPVESARTNKSANPNPNPNPKILKS
jgi:four helix bundle protein